MKRSLLVVMTALLCLVTVVTAVSAESTQQSQVLSPSKDNTLIENPNGDLTSSAVFVGRTNQPEDSIRRGLVAFNIAEAIPAGSTVKSVTLTLNMVRTPGRNQPIELHRVLSDWGEASFNTPRGKGEPATKGAATWMHSFFNTDFWSKPGGDFAPQASAVQTIDGGGTYTWGSTPEMVADVQAWLDSPKDNFGWLLLGNEKAPKTVKVFASRESQDSSVRPQLTVSFEPPR